ncbi:hypothetical protein TTHERM_000414359 (macronuclear) [Tetrahymena thermophila SB210]|uniref:Uncharacterized protein n=1 Tax=Tetrahymena thermophila (strain SB210) TaxID=312017 RepID=W7XB41_TETTS|nr:hypothetical protein TTHERM_000414359 [Tetrahymena thermophila SB210]EWS76595.1 hypothetical protein TTHERM_000414359 [Tetrahymena thermophila SB210]|eukprot:XP_012650881.1 hypothetical protein TTHERM_000414359 [Tetrahymena thermophila SB210]
MLLSLIFILDEFGKTLMLNLESQCLKMIALFIQSQLFFGISSHVPKDHSAIAKILVRSAKLI